MTGGIILDTWVETLHLSPQIPEVRFSVNGNNRKNIYEKNFGKNAVILAINSSNEAPMKMSIVVHIKLK